MSIPCLFDLKDPPHGVFSIPVVSEEVGSENAILISFDYVRIEAIPTAVGEE